VNLLANLIRWCKEELATLKQQLKMLENGTMRTHERRVGCGMVDTTAETALDVRRKIAELEALLARHPEPTD